MQKCHQGISATARGNETPNMPAASSHPPDHCGEGCPSLSTSGDPQIVKNQKYFIVLGDKILPDYLT